MEKSPEFIRCLRCGNTDIIDRGKTYICKACRLEFDKELLETFEWNPIYSMGEKMGFLYTILLQDKKK